MPTFTTIYQCHQSYPFLPVLRESARYVFFKEIRSLSRRRMLFSQTISTPNGAVGSLIRFIFVPSLLVFWYSSHLRWVFSSPSPLHRFIFTSPSHTTKKTERIRTFHTDANYLVMSLCKRINHNQSLKIKSKLINLHNFCFLSNHVHNFPSLFGQKLFGSRD